MYIYKLTLLENTKTYKKGETYIGRHVGTNKYYFCSGKIPNEIIKKYSKEIFRREIIHDNIKSEEELNALEIYYINYYGSFRLNTGFGLNLNIGGENIRNDDVSGINNPNYNNRWTIEMKEKMSDIKRNQHKDTNIYNDQWKKKIGKAASKMWQNQELKNQMSKNVSKAKTNYRICQFDRDNNLINVYNTMPELLEQNPEFKKMPIYSTCNGWKRSYKNFIWRYQDIETDNIIEPNYKLGK